MKKTRNRTTKLPEDREDAHGGCISSETPVNSVVWRGWANYGYRQRSHPAPTLWPHPDVAAQLDDVRHLCSVVPGPLEAVA